MTEAKPNLWEIKWVDEQVRATITLARYRACKIMELRYREARIKLASVKPSQLTAEAEARLAAHPELIEACASGAPKAWTEIQEFR